MTAKKAPSKKTSKGELGPRALKALKASIHDKWEPIIAGNGLDGGTDNCPLCNIYFRIDVGFECSISCPVKAKTGLDLCYGTPYEKWILLSHTLKLNDQDDGYNLTPGQKRRAVAELDFLKSLLPKKPKKKPGSRSR